MNTFKYVWFYYYQELSYTYVYFWKGNAQKNVFTDGERKTF